MRDAKDLTVAHAIVHRINHIKQDLTLSDDELALAANPKLRDYFSDQVANALNDGQASSARFNKNGDQAAFTEIQKILNHKKDFIGSSRTLAQLLMQAMGRDARIKPEDTNIAICLFNASNYKGANFLAVIKIDPHEALVEKVVMQKGKQVVTFEVLSDVMPTKEMKLRKAALIPPVGTVKDLDLLLLDRQVAAVAANFFAVTFLNTLEVLDPAKSVRNFVFVAEKARKILVNTPVDSPAHIGPKESDAYVRHIEAAIMQPSVDREKFVKQSPLPPAAQKVVQEHLQKEFPQDKRIKLDRQYAQEHLTKKKRYRGDNGFLLEVEADYYDEIVKTMKHDPPRPDGTIITRVTLEIPNLYRITG